jgi:hypothetical protein
VPAAQPREALTNLGLKVLLLACRYQERCDRFRRSMPLNERVFKLPVIFDIRASRSVRASGFRGDASEQPLPSGRYRWSPRLGNARITSRGLGIKIAIGGNQKAAASFSIALRSKLWRLIPSPMTRSSTRLPQGRPKPNHNL